MILKFDIKIVYWEYDLIMLFINLHKIKFLKILYDRLFDLIINIIDF